MNYVFLAALVAGGVALAPLGMACVRADDGRDGAIVFARPAARPFGVLLIAVLLWAWRLRR